MMKMLETERLILREFREDDFDAVHSYAGCTDNTVYWPWGTNSEDDTKTFIRGVINETMKEDSRRNYIYAAILKDTGKLIGDCDISLEDGEMALGWTLHRDYWKQGYGTEMGRALLEFGFEELCLHRITAHCDSENNGSYGIMEKIGMRREGLFLEARPAHKLSNKKYGDELHYAILKDE